MQDYTTRSLEPILEKAVSEFPAVVLTGPRQSGKTTLLQRLFGRRCRYVSAAMLRLLPLSRRESERRPRMTFPWESTRRLPPDRSHVFGDLWTSFLRGGYPELATQPHRDVSLWHASYIFLPLGSGVTALPFANL